MKKHIKYTAIIILVIILSSFAQNKNDFICLSEKEFDIPELSKMIGVGGNYRAIFDVKNFAPENIKIESIDNSNILIEDFKKFSFKNIHKIAYLKDTLNVELILHYKIKSGKIISTDYAEAISPNEINFVFRKIVRYNMDPAFYYSSDSLTLIELVPVVYPLKVKSEILVERKYFNDTSITVILQNNLKEMEEVILGLANRYPKDKFLESYKHAKFFFIRFEPYLSYPDCDGFHYFYD